jgi:Tol biopolymer transport system component
MRKNVLIAVAVAASIAVVLARTASATYPGSNDGRLAFATNVGGNVDIYSVLPNGNDLRRLTSGPSFDACPSYSADGKEIAFCSGQLGGSEEIWTMKQNGSEQKQVTHLGGQAIFPDFSPDGSKILFSARVAADQHSNLYVVNADGSGLVQLTSGAGNNSYPVWSPDGSKIAFISDRSGFEEVWVMNADGSGATQLTTDPTFKGQLPDWSPNGSKIAYADSVTGTSDVYVMNADGSDQTRLTTSPDIEFGAAWSPDATQIAYVRFVNGNPNQRTVFVMNADGTDQHAVHPGPGFQLVPGWQPRGERDGSLDPAAAASYRFDPLVRHCIVPNVKGKTLQAAKTAIKRHACRVGKIRRVFSTKAKKGHVISQRPHPGAQRSSGTTVSLAVSKGKRPPPPPPYCPPSITGTGGLHSTACVPITGTTTGAAVGFGSVWVRTGAGLFRIDASTNTVVANIQGLPGALGTYGTAVATGEGAVWTSNIGAGSVSRIDPATNTIVATIPVWPTNSGCGGPPSTTCSSPIGIATTPGAVWVVLHHEWDVVRIDPATNNVVATISIGASSNPVGPESITAANGLVYVGGNDPGTGALFLKRIDPATNAATPILRTSGYACDGKAADGDHVWLATEGCDGNSIADVDAASASIVARVDLGAPMFQVSIGVGSVWVVTGKNELIRIDPATHSITGRIAFPPGLGVALSVDQAAVWLALDGFVYRIEQ